jgi:MarR family transcriptional regulator, lower aerobic nicotinate degradation pathway regulator
MMRRAELKPSDQERAPFIPAALRASLGFLLSRVGGEAHRRFVQTLGAWDLRPAHYAILAVLAELDAASQRDLAVIVGVDPRNLVAVVDLLEGRGLVTRGADPRDRRRHAVRLTTAGRELLRTMRAASDAAEEELLAVLSGGERAALHALLSQLLPAVQHGPKD